MLRHFTKVGLLVAILGLSPAVHADDSANRIPVGAAVFGGVEPAPTRKIASQSTNTNANTNKDEDGLDATDSGVDQHPLQKSDDFFNRAH